MSSNYSNVDQWKMLAFHLSTKQRGNISRFLYHQNMHGSIFSKLIHPQTSSSFPRFLSQFLIRDDYKPPRLRITSRRRQTSSFKYPELNVMNKAMNLGFYEMLGDLSLINREVDRYRAVTDEDIRSFSRRTLRPENSSTLIYNARK